MSLRARQITLVISTATNLVTVANGFQNIQGGSLQDPLPIIVKNEDGALTVYIGGPDVDATHGLSLAAGQSLPMALYGGDTPWAFCGTGTPVISVLAGRQG